MASRKKRHVNTLVTTANLGGLVFCLFLLRLVGLAAQNPGFLILFLIAVFGLPLLVFVVRAKNRKKARQNLITKANAAIEQHMASLMRKRAQLVTMDAYGKPLLDQWNKEIKYFITNHITPLLTPKEQAALTADCQEIIQLIITRSYSATQAAPLFKAFNEGMSPLDFEAFCAEQLRISGWSTQVTKGSRDQGVDVVAEKSGIRVVLQCKLYSGPVGNKAVQEIVAGVAHEQAHFGAVVTNNRYTSPAEQLAATNCILLLHYSDLANLDAALSAEIIEPASRRRRENTNWPR